MLLPVDLIHLPLNMNVVDVWVLLGIPFVWLGLVRGPNAFGWPYALAMLFILAGGLTSSFGARFPGNGLIVILKEAYVFVWFATVVAVLSRLGRRAFQVMVAIWALMVLAHGVIILAEFVSPQLWRAVAHLAGRTTVYAVYRPTGLFVNPNLAAFFQMLGFVPLLLARLPMRWTLPATVLLLTSALATGSMGATVAFLVGLVVALAALAASGRLDQAAAITVRYVLSLVVLAGVFQLVVSHNARYQNHLEQILVGRANKSSEGRFSLWQRGLDLFVQKRVVAWGVGPDNYRFYDIKDKPPHNDLLAFMVERGLISVLGLVMFAGISVWRSFYLVLLYNRLPERVPLVSFVFLGAMMATIVESLTHQIFHFRELWLVLAMQEAVIYRLTALEPPSQRQSQSQPELQAQSQAPRRQPAA